MALAPIICCSIGTDCSKGGHLNNSIGCQLNGSPDNAKMPKKAGMCGSSRVRMLSLEKLPTSASNSTKICLPSKLTHDDNV